MSEQQPFSGDGLWHRALAATAQARASGALQPIETSLHVVEQAGIPFTVRVLAGRAGHDAVLQKEVSSNVDPAPAVPPAGQPGTGRLPHRPAFDPFLPYEPDMFVADLSATHVCLLNKFNVIDHHLLVVTRAYEEQEAAITAADFAALWQCMAAVEGLAFYNAGKLGGASQRHKHLQLAPFPLGAGHTALPVEPALDVGSLSDRPAVRTQPYPHAAIRLDLAWLAAPQAAGEGLLDRYRLLLEELDMRLGGAEGLLPPYNMLATRTWMMLVPRTHEESDGIAVNALGFAGSLLARSTAQLEYLRTIGPLTVLHNVARAAA